jgi:hypothetical protein
MRDPDSNTKNSGVTRPLKTDFVTCVDRCQSILALLLIGVWGSRDRWFESGRHFSAQPAATVVKISHRQVTLSRELHTTCSLGLDRGNTSKFWVGQSKRLPFTHLVRLGAIGSYRRAPVVRESIND